MGGGEGRRSQIDATPDSPAAAAARLDRTLAATLGSLGSLAGRPDLPGAAAGLTVGPHRGDAADEPRASANGSSRLIRTADEWIALTLARPWDREALPALSRGQLATDASWEEIGELAASARAEDLVGRARQLDLAVARWREVPATSSPWRQSRIGGGSSLDLAGSRVVDLSSLWAGPLAAQLLRELGAEVTKVESSDRPDGLRDGEPEQFERLNRGKVELTLDFGSGPDRARLRRLCEEADVVVISARRRAAASLGLDLLAPPPTGSRLILAISAHGWTGPGSHFVGFGDDAAVAGGLTGRARDGGPAFVADAAADPLTGALGALATAAAASRGGSWFIDAPLALAAAFAADPAGLSDPLAAVAQVG